MAKAIASQFNTQTGERKPVYEGQGFLPGYVLENEAAKQQYGFGALDPNTNRLVRTAVTPSGLPDVPTIDEAQKQAQETSAFQEGKSLIDKSAEAATKPLQEQKQLTTESYDLQREQTAQSFTEQKQNLIQSFQDALDQINFAAREVGITTRAGSSRRELYDASGQLSGIGRNVAARALEPITQRVASTTKAYQTNLGNLGTREQQAYKSLGIGERDALSKINAALSDIPLSVQEKTMSLRDSIVKSIIDAAEKNRDIANKSIADQIKYNQDLEKKQMDFQQKVALEQIKASLKGSTKSTTTKNGDITVDAGKGYKVSRNYDRTSGTYTGLTFLDPKGLPVSPLEFAQKTGRTLPEILGGSNDPGDKQFIQDYNQLFSMIGQQLPDGRTLTPEVAYQELSKDYGWIFGIQNTPQPQTTQQTTTAPIYGPAL